MLLFQVATSIVSQAATNRIRTAHRIGWYNTFVFLSFRSRQGSIQAEYQWRRRRMDLQLATEHVADRVSCSSCTRA